MLTLFPDIKPNAQHRIAVDPPHELFVEESGNPDGIPILVVHGGPGGGCEDYHRRFFDAERYRIILMDQRGAGRSRPLAEFVGNTTQNLVDDMETVRTFLGVDRWILFGGSWGATLSLVYAQSHPDRVLGLVLRGIFLCRPRDIHWFYQEGASRVVRRHGRGRVGDVGVVVARVVVARELALERRGDLVLLEAKAARVTTQLAEADAMAAD